MTKATEGLRFAPLIRVSTEGQEDKKQSLLDQTAAIKQYVQFLGGTIVGWQYCGQEHSTPDHERKKLDQLLADCSKNKFDAVMVYDASRWSRDTYKHKEAAKVFKEHGIRFFTGTIELDLFNPTSEVVLDMQVVLAEHQAKIQKLKSITSRIGKAKRGIPSAGKLPYGRTYDEKKGWSVDKEKQKKIQWAAERYLAGDSIPVLAETLGMNIANLWKILNKRSGDKWELRFKAKDLNVDETVIIEMPRLLDEQSIQAIHERADAQRTYTHGEIKHRYLLSRMIFCAKCGGALFGQTNHSGTRHYRHTKHRKPNDCHLEKFVPADLIENAVLLHLVQTFGDVELIQRAVERATPDMSKIEKLTEEQNNLQRELKKVLGQKDNVIDMVADGLLSKDEVKSRMDKLRDRESSIQGRLASIEAQLQSVPDPSKVKRLSKLGIKVLADMTRNSPDMIFKKSYEWKRNLVEHAFGGRDTKAQRLGVYISETGNPNHPWSFEIRGVLESTILGLPLKDGYLEEAFKLDPYYQDVEAELREIKTSFAWR
jgi:site-specific DNA recombinase